MKKATTTLGRQPNSDTFIFGPTIHVSSDGRTISVQEQEYLWVQEIVECAAVLPTSSPLLKALPKCREPLHLLLKGLETLTQKNLISSVFILGQFLCVYACIRTCL